MGMEVEYDNPPDPAWYEVLVESVNVRCNSSTGQDDATGWVYLAEGTEDDPASLFPEVRATSGDS